MIILINTFLTCNEPIYNPKSSNNRLTIWVTKRMKRIKEVITYTFTSVETYVLNNWKTKHRKPRARKLFKNRMVSYGHSALAMNANIGIRTNTLRFDTDSVKVGIDNRCSACISHVPQDFIGPLKDSNRTIKGFGRSRTTGIKVGTLLWRWNDDEGKEHAFHIPESYYVPDGKVRLLSPQHWAKHQQKSYRKEKRYHGTLSQTTCEEVTLMWNDRKARLTVPLAKENNVATFYLAPGFTNYYAFCAQAGLDDEKDQNDPLTCHQVDHEAIEENEDSEIALREGTPWESNPKITQFHDDTWKDKKTLPALQEPEGGQLSNSAAFLRLHQRLGHMSFAKMKLMARKGIIKTEFKNTPIPVCAACTYAKMIRKPWRNKPSTSYEREVTSNPGDVVSVDQLVSPTPGLIAQMTGRLTTQRYKYVTVYVDQHSKLGYIYIQKTATAEETVQGKKAFERYMLSLGITVKRYQADNGIFRAHKWMDACKESKQSISFVGVNAHHQNGQAERRIRELQDAARTMLIHASKKWPDGVTANLWPYALRMASDTFNNAPDLSHKEGRTPLQIASKSDVSINTKHRHTFGSPVYVLDNDLQQQKPHGKWKDRAQVGIYLGPSPHHNRNVALVLNRKTGLVSPQFHVKHDDYFETINDIPNINEWKIKAGFIIQREVKQKEQLLSKTRKELHESVQTRYPHKRGSDAIIDNKHDTSSMKRGKTNNHNPTSHDSTSKAPNDSHQKDDSMTENLRSDVSRGLRRSPRLNPSLGEGQKLLSLQATISSVACNKNEIEGEILREGYPIDQVNDDLIAYKASTDPDIMYMHEAMRQPDRDKFVSAMQKEINDQMKNKNFSIVKRSEVPSDKSILPAVWQMRRKRDIKSRTIKKYKARLNIDGSRMQKGLHYDQTYAPVVSWTSIRLLLALVAMKGWHTQQIDYVLAFPQAPVEKEIYMKIPKGFEVDSDDPNEYVLKLHRNVYGQKQAGRVWNKYLEHKLIHEVGFTKSKVDECVFYKGNTMYILYTDDSIIAGPDKIEIEQIIADIEKSKLNITREGDIEDFLGI